MAVQIPPGVSEMAREGWQRLLTSKVPEAELEPPVRRRQRRYKLQWGFWSLLFQDPAGKLVQTGATLLNAAFDGVMLRTKIKVPDGADVLLVFSDDDQDFALRGDAMHCTGTVGGYKTGVQLKFV